MVKTGFTLIAFLTLMMAESASGNFLISQPVSGEGKLEWCYGVYHASKPSQEVKKYDQILSKIPEYADITQNEHYKSGVEQAPTIPADQKTACYDRIYTALADKFPNQAEPVRSKPYCFGYLSVALGIDTIPPFCRVKCQYLSQNNCQKICEDDLRQNLNRSRVGAGRDAATSVEPAQYLQCMSELDRMR